MRVKDGVGILTVGQRAGDDLSISNYIWSDGRYTMTPVISDLICQMEGSSAKGNIKANYNLYRLGVTEELLSTLEGTQSHILIYEISEKFRQGEFIMEFGYTTLTSREQMEWLKIQVPEEKTVVDKTIRFEDCTLRIRSVEKAEPRVYGNYNGEEDGQK